METKNQKTIEKLNDLLEINNDRIEGYKHASKETEETDLKTLFAQLSETSSNCKQQLIGEIKKLGGAPIEGTRTTDKLYRSWMDIKSAISNKNRKAILSSCELGEDVALKNYKEILKTDHIDSALHALITNQYTLIKADHDKIRDLRDLVKA